MDIYTESIPELFACLSDTFVKLSGSKTLLNQPLLTKYERKAKLKRKIYNTLFQYLRGPHR